MIVTVPSLPTSTCVSFGRSGLAFSTASLTFAFSASVKFAGSATSITAGLFGSVLSAVVGSFLAVSVTAAVVFPASSLDLDENVYPSFNL